MSGDAFHFFSVFSVKLLMMDQANIFICIPLAEWFAKVSFFVDLLVQLLLYNLRQVICLFPCTVMTPSAVRLKVYNLRDIFKVLKTLNL